MSNAERFISRLEGNYLTEKDLIELAAAARGLVLDPERTGFVSESICKFTLDDDLVEKLKAFRFTFRGEDNGTIYLNSNLPQDRGSGIHESTVWAFDKSASGPYFLEVRMTLGINIFYRGVILQPEFQGNNKGGPTHRPTINALARAFAAISPDTKLIREMKEDPFIVVNWKEICRGGIKRVAALFQELYSTNEKVLELSETRASPFNPCPKESGSLYIPEPYQSDLLRLWMIQLEEYKRTL